MYTEWVHIHFHFRIEFLFFGNYLYVFLYTWPQGGVCFLRQNIFRLVLQVRGESGKVIANLAIFSDILAIFIANLKFVLGFEPRS